MKTVFSQARKICNHVNTHDTTLHKINSKTKSRAKTLLDSFDG
jgi:hypothetical protein